MINDIMTMFKFINESGYKIDVSTTNSRESHLEIIFSKEQNRKCYVYSQLIYYGYEETFFQILLKFLCDNLFDMLEDKLCHAKHISYLQIVEKIIEDNKDKVKDYYGSIYKMIREKY